MFICLSVYQQYIMYVKMYANEDYNYIRQIKSMFFITTKKNIILLLQSNADPPPYVSSCTLNVARLYNYVLIIINKLYASHLFVLVVAKLSIEKTTINVMCRIGFLVRNNVRLFTYVVEYLLLTRVQNTAFFGFWDC